MFGGDTYPNEWFVKYAKDADLAVHEAFTAVPDMIEKLGWPVDRSLEVATQIHTASPAFGKIMNLIKPRMAVAYHFFHATIVGAPILAAPTNSPGKLSIRDRIE